MLGRHNVERGCLYRVWGVCGKSVSALSLIRLNPFRSRIVGGQVLWKGRDLFKLSQREIKYLRGREISMIFHPLYLTRRGTIVEGRSAAKLLLENAIKLI